MKKLIFILCLGSALTILIGAIVATKSHQFKAMGEAAKAGGPPPTSVSTSLAESQTWERSLRAVGSIEPIQGVVLEAEMPGLVRSIEFENGELVEADKVLVQFDVDVEKAQLRAAVATAKLAELDFERSQRLRESGNVPQSQLDQATADLDRAEAEIENIQAIIERKTIRAPFSGRIGIRQINLGQYVPQGAPIVSLQSYDKVYVNFNLPQQNLSLLEVGLPVSLTTDAFPEKQFSGKLTAFSPQIDPITRTVEIQGTLDNSDGLLRAGLFVQVSVTLPKADAVTAVPQTAIMYAPYGNSIYKVEQAEDGEGLIAKQYFVRTGRRLGDFVSIVEGIEPGDEIVSAGAFKLRNAAPITINDDLKPEPQKDPTPKNS